jgi:hypothetical protein
MISAGHSAGCVKSPAAVSAVVGGALRLADLESRGNQNDLDHPQGHHCPRRYDRGRN